jgi:hypothetical protein
MIRRLRWSLYDFIDRLDTYCLEHTWVPVWARVRVGKWWIWTFKDKTWTAVGDAPFGPSPFEVQVPCRWDEYGDAIDWMRFSNTHKENFGCHQSCVIHNRTAHHMQHWPLHWRGDRGIFERICEHEIGHPDPDQGPYWAATDQDWQWVHGCDGCCRNPATI